MVSKLTISTQLTYANLRGYLDAFSYAARATGVDRDLLLAVASRESAIGMTLGPDWLGDSGYGIGLMQIDRRFHERFARTHRPRDNRANVLYAARLLKDLLGRFGGVKKYALAAYNAGPDDVVRALRQGVPVDTYTTGGDYSTDVLSRYRIIKQMGAAERRNGHWVNVPDRPEKQAVRQVVLGSSVLLSGILVVSYYGFKRIGTDKNP